MAIFFDEKLKAFYLESKNVTYAFRVNEYGFLQHLYYGKRISRDDLNYSVHLLPRGRGATIYGAKGANQSLNNYGNECPTFGRGDFRESMLSFCDDKGVRVGDLQYDGYEILDKKPSLDGMPSVRGEQTLVVRLKDLRMKVTVSLFYTVFEDLPVILRHTEILNDGNESFALERAYSFNVDMNDANWDVLTLYGAHNRERSMQRTPVSRGIFSVDSRKGCSSAHMNPFMAIMRKNTDENVGEVYGYNLVWSGDFTFKAQVEENETLRVTGGINDYDFAWELGKGEKFTTPEMVMVYSDEGLGGMSRAFHDLYRSYLINTRFVHQARPIVINTWEAVIFNFDTQKLCEIIDSVADTGIEMLVLDDGWFGARNSDTAGLGDWFVNKEKLPQGLTPVIEYAHKKGMKFGLWFEPEMVNKDSDLYRAHPEWVIRVDDLEPCLGRNQLVLDLTRDDVCEYIIESISKILRENAIDYVKWDMNRSLTDNYSTALGCKSKETHHRYVLGLYKICEAIVNGFPNVLFEGCASGGARFDPAMLYYFPQIWTSDNTDAYARTHIQYGTSMCYPLSTQSCHVACCPSHQTGRITPFATRGDIAHLGITGYELDTTKCSDEERAMIKKQIEQYKKMEDLVLYGDLYRLNNPLEENLFAEMLVSKDKSKAHITVMRPLAMSNQEIIRVYPKGLDKTARYYIPELELVLGGDTLMQVGLVAQLQWGDFTTKTFTLERIEK